MFLQLLLKLTIKRMQKPAAYLQFPKLFAMVSTDKFFPGYIFFDQAQIKAGMLCQINDANILRAKFPTEFDRKSFPIQDQGSDYYSTTLSIKQTTVNEFKKDRSTNIKFEHIIVADLGTGPHSLYVHDFDSINEVVNCKNSWGPKNNPTPSIKIGDIMHFYRVSAAACTISLQQATTVQQVTSLLSNQNLHSSTTSPSLQQTQASVVQDIGKIDEIINNCKKIWYNYSLSELLQAARLTFGGHIKSLKYLRLNNINLDQIPPQQLASLVSCVTDTVDIDSVEGSLEIVLKVAKSKFLRIENTTLDASKTLLLVEALKYRIGILNICENVVLDFDTLQRYNGLGKCWRIEVFSPTSEPHKYLPELKKYGKKLGWTGTRNYNLFYIRRT